MAKVELYTKSWCGYCNAAKRLLKSKGVSFVEVDVEDDADRLPEMIRRAGGRRTVPQIFINDRHIGGSDDLHLLDRQGGLDPLLRG